MSSNRTRRVAKELADIVSDKHSKVFAEMDPGQNSMSHLRASFTGPSDTPYEQGTFIIDIGIPDDYPFKPPIMKFVTKVWHPNISSQTGAICLDTLGSAWSPVLTIKAALLSLQSLLGSPEPKDPQDAEVASMMIKHPYQFLSRAREWSIKYAGAPTTVDFDRNLADMAAQQSQPVSKSMVALNSRVEAQIVESTRYQGYNKDLIDRFVNMGFDLDRVVEAFVFVNIDRNNGEDYELEQEYMGDITARLLGEP